jgi:DegV family protein with EDD domain
MRQAGVVDAGALGMFLFFEALLAALAGGEAALRSPVALFGRRVRRPAAVTGPADAGACINAWIRGVDDPSSLVRQAAGMGESLVTTTLGRDVKVHLHARHPEQVARRLNELGEVAGWEASPLEGETPAPAPCSTAVHVMTDAAGSLPPEAARALGVTLLDSYVVFADASRPETLTDPAAVYAALGQGERVSTAQSSNFERHQRYGMAVSRFERVLYLCVGSVYTGNHAAALAWCRDHDPEGRMTVIDSGAAAGRLGLMALALARHAGSGHESTVLQRYVRVLMEGCDELVFLDRLKFLAAGGRVSKTGGLLGDLLRLRPVVSPTALGVRKVGLVRRRRDQLPFALARMTPLLGDGNGAILMLEYSDNRDRVECEIRPAMAARFPAAEILVHPLSLTSGVHMGPGTWAVAFLRLPAAGGGR